MSAIETMIQAEYFRVSRLISRLEDECMQRPKGSLVLKKRGNLEYAYIVKRENGKVITEYIGKAGSWKVKGAEAKILERKRYEGELREASKQLVKLKKMMKASDVFFVEPTR
jgi:hypothetical protein